MKLDGGLMGALAKAGTSAKHLESIGFEEERDCWI